MTRGNQQQQQQERLQEDAANILQNEQSNQSYQNEWNRFKKWVDENLEELGLDEPSPYLTRWNVDAYFSAAVIHRDGQQNSIRRIVSALEWYARYVEYPRGGFEVDSNDVKQAIRVQQINWADKQNADTDDKCPHRFCKDMMPPSERKKLLRAAYLHPDWATASMALNWGQNAAVRGSSMRNMTLKDLRISDGFGPDGYVEGGEQSRALMLILRSGAVHKDRFTSVKQVCTWRHWDYLLCPNFSTALLLLWKLRHMGRRLKFQKARGGGRPKWWDEKLIDWTTYSRKF